MSTEINALILTAASMGVTSKKLKMENFYYAYG